MAGLNPNIRLPGPEDEAMPDGVDVVVDISDDDLNGDKPVLDEKGNVLEIEHGDGSISVSLDGKPIERSADRKPLAWFDNLVEDIDDSELSRIADDLLRGVRDDIETRRDWVEDRANGVKLLGLKIEIPGLGGLTDGAPVEGMSRIRHPLLLEAVLRFQANARSELLPTDGPAKIRNDDNNATSVEDTIANALEKDINHYLTSTATEYYPDTDRMLLMLGFGGTSFKKIYFCPLRNRPVSESVDADDLIVNNAATDLSNAKRITHRTYMRPSTVKRLQILGVYRDIQLDTPLMTDPDSLKLEQLSQQGIDPGSLNPDDRDREIYEIYCELNIIGFEHKWKGKDSGLEIPYRVTIDVSSRKILSIVRNFDEDTEDLPQARDNFVKYTFVPGFGFYDIGLLHILGNTTNAITAAWRELLDAGMFANFPGFLIAKSASRQNTNVFRIPPGGGAQIDTAGGSIRDAAMPLPYKEPSTALMHLVDNMATTGMRIGGTAEQAVGEGKADAPVGTTLALIEQATKVLNSVHKRMHRAQSEELALIVRTFREHPESFWQRNKKKAYPWDEQTFLKALDDCDLVPQSDPNTSSQTQRLMKIAAVMQLAAAQPALYDPIAINKMALQAIGFSDPEAFMAPPEAQAKPPPELVAQQAKTANETKVADAKVLDAQTKAQQAAMQAQNPSAQPGPTPQELALKAADLKIKGEQVRFQQQRASVEDQNRDKDRETDLEIAKIHLREQMIRDHAQHEHERDMHVTGLVSDHVKQLTDLQHTSDKGED